MNKLYFLLIFAFFWILFRSNQYFEDRLNQAPEVKALTSTKRFFLPYPKNYEIISETEEQSQVVRVIKTSQDKKSLNSFYQEILRIKGYEKEYELENEDFIEFKYSKKNEEVIINLSSENNQTNIIFKTIN
jgi:hypothetical protein